ncbi:MAG: fibronectin type III domain-containing protein [Thermodesulfovibrionales bacterium]|jgi:hypothetical protein
MKKQTRPLSLILLCLILSCLSCGTKGDPTLKSFVKPDPVTEVRALHREGEIIISWSYPRAKRETIQGFLVEKSENGSFRKTASLKPDSSEYRDRDFLEGREYTYRIRAVSLRDLLSDDSPLLKVRPAVLPPSPKGLSYLLGPDSLEVRWTKGAEGVLYNIYRKKGSAPYQQLPVNREPLAEASFRDRVETAVPVYYTVRPLLPTELRDEGFPSEELVVDPASFVPSSPSGLRYIPSDKGVYLTWTENEASWSRGYRIYRRREGESLFAAIGESSVPAFHDREPAAGKVAYFVTVMGPGKESGPSEIVETEKREEQ